MEREFMLFYYTLFLFIAFGSKLLLALVMIYLLLPSERSCNSCDGETLMIHPTGTGGLLARLSRGRIQQRWCPRCEWYGLSRRVPPPPSLQEAPPARRRPESGGRAKPPP
jgi:hypothetical protein